MIQTQSTKKTILHAGGVVKLDVQGLSLLAIDISGTFVGTTIFEYTINGTDWHTLTANIVGSAISETGATAPGKWIANVAGFLAVRVRCSAYTSGSIVVAMRAVLSAGLGGLLGFDNNGSLKVAEQFAPGYEDNVANVAKVEQRGTPFRVTADGQVKAGAGFVYNIEIAPLTATPTAGLLTIYDSLTETGTILYSEWVFADAPGRSIILNRIFSTGLYVGFDATLANVQVSGSYR